MKKIIFKTAEFIGFHKGTYRINYISLDEEILSQYKRTPWHKGFVLSVNMINLCKIIDKEIVEKNILPYYKYSENETYNNDIKKYAVFKFNDRKIANMFIKNILMPAVMAQKLIGDK